MKEFTVTTWDGVTEKDDEIVIGAEKKKKDVEIISTSQLHALIVGTTGSGKTTSFVDQNIAVLGRSKGKAICRALNKIIENKQEAMDLIMTNLSYAVTGDDDVLYISSIENQLKELDDEIDRAVRLSQNSEGDPERFRQMISELCRQMTVLRQELELTKAKLATNEKVSAEIERIRETLSDETVKFSEYDEITVRRLVEYIRVMSDGRIIVVLKGGMSIEEPIEEKSE